jgi:hypothetical protein
MSDARELEVPRLAGSTLSHHLSELSRHHSHVRGWLKNGNNQGSETCFLHARRLTQNGAVIHTNGSRDT